MLNYESVKGWAFPVLKQSFGREDCARYALSINIGANSLDGTELAYANGAAPHAFPTMATILGRIGHWLSDPRTGVDHSKMLIGEVGLVLERPLPSEGEIIARHRVKSVTDKGRGKGALICVEREISDALTGTVLARFFQTSFCRADGGFSEGGDGDVYEPLIRQFPEQGEIQVIQLRTLPQQALLFALNGDRNPIHIDPEHAAKVGLAGPILHGMGVLGILTAGLSIHVAEVLPERILGVMGRFVHPVLPGESLRLEVARGQWGIHFRAFSESSGKPVFDGGWLQLREG